MDTLRFATYLKNRETQKKKLREATYTAAVCKFWGGHLFVFGLVPSVAQLSSASFFTWMVSTIFRLRGAHRPRPPRR